jgi:hypothetical protein
MHMHMQQVLRSSYSLQDRTATGSVHHSMPCCAVCRHTDSVCCKLDVQHTSMMRLTVSVKLCQVIMCLAVLAAVQVLAHVPPMQRERVAQLLMMPNYLRKLLDIFRVSQQVSCKQQRRDSASAAPQG